MQAARSSKGRDYGHGGCGRHSVADLELFLLMVISTGGPPPSFVISTGGRRPERRNLAANLPCHYGRPGTPDLIAALAAQSLARRCTLRQCAARFLDCATAPLEMTSRNPFPAFPSEQRHHIPTAPEPASTARGVSSNVSTCPSTWFVIKIPVRTDSALTCSETSTPILELYTCALSANNTNACPACSSA